MATVAVATWLVGTPAQAQAPSLPDNVPTTPPPPPPGVSAALDSARAESGAHLTVSVYTYGPGSAVFERFGHIALAIADDRTGEEVAFNWGMFDFNQPNFIPRFLTGDTRYWMEGYRAAAFNAVYQSEDRSIRRQVLALDPVARGALRDFVVWNAAEQNKYYRYDYYNDNCSTRIRDAIDWALQGRLRRALAGSERGLTWRDETARITATDLPVYAGIQLALGQPADRDLTAWQEGFLPEHLALHLARVQFADAAGRPTPLVREDTVLYRAMRAPLDTAAPDRRAAAALIGVLLGVVFLLLARAPGAAARTALTALGTAWFAVGGVLGTLLLLAGTVTRHAEYMGRNLSLFQVHPLLLVAAACWWARGRAGAAGRTAHVAVSMVAVIALVGVVAQHLPLFHQHNTEVWFLTAPVHLSAALALRLVTRRSATMTPVTTPRVDRLA
ncbi:MAG: DUF4105 domain-containing protein [Gemmatimonadetes bacterium]|nr:DUF4105 domain-containing protein [Gemmatimonadota bacterium]